MQDLLTAGLESLGLDPESQPLGHYLKYIELLEKWNKAYNLTAIKKPEEMLSRHVVDSLSVLPFIKGTRCLDIGTGAGLPGLILAIAQPEIKWLLLDSNQKKIRFLRHVKADIKLDNVEALHSRIEEFVPNNNIDTIICRAFAPLGRMLQLTEHLINDENQLLAMKGKSIDEEVSELNSHKLSIKINDIAVFNDETSAKLVQINKAE